MKRKCWEILECPIEIRVKCPASKNPEIDCWEILGTLCFGKMQNVGIIKINTCGACKVYLEDIPVESKNTK